MTLLPDLLRSLIPQRHTQKMADPDPMTCDPGSRVYDPDPGTVIPDYHIPGYDPDIVNIEIKRSRKVIRVKR